MPKYFYEKSAPISSAGQTFGSANAHEGGG
jgi:hypothetical protein